MAAVAPGCASAPVRTGTISEHEFTILQEAKAEFIQTHPRTVGRNGGHRKLFLWAIANTKNIFGKFWVVLSNFCSNEIKDLSLFLKFKKIHTKNFIL